MLLQVDDEGDKITGFFSSPKRSLCDFASTVASIQDSLPDQVRWLRLKTAIANIFGIYPIPVYTAHRGLLLLQDCLMPSGKAFFTKNARYYFHNNIPRRSVTICAKGKRWFMAAHSAPKEVSKVNVESFHTATGRSSLEAALIAKATLSLSWGWWWVFP